jgi:hypothetical protein
MRPKHILWLSVAALALSWYLLDPEAGRDLGGTPPGAEDRVATATPGGQMPTGPQSAPSRPPIGLN